MYQDEKVADVRIINNTQVEIKKYSSIFYKQPFLSDKHDIMYVYDFLKSRCYEDGRSDLKEILAAAGMQHNDPWQWVKLTHGATYDDFWWVKFPGETITWKDVKLR